MILAGLAKHISSNPKYLLNMFVDWTSKCAKPPFKWIVLRNNAVVYGTIS